MKKRILVDLRIVCDAPNGVGRYLRTLEEKARHLEAWCREFEAFVRDHRSQDPVSMNVDRVYQEQCSHCGSEWETESDGLPVCCDKAQKEWDEAKPAIAA